MVPGLEGVTAALVSDALDRVGLRHQCMAPGIAPLRPGMRLVGRAFPITVEATDVMPEDPYVSEIRAIDGLGRGEVPVYSVAPEVDTALWGELFSCAAIGRGAAGVVVDGFVRDAEQIAGLGFATFARGTSPLDTMGRAEVREYGTPAPCGGVLVNHGDAIVADEDGVAVVPAGALDDVVAVVSEKLRGERGALADLLAGKSLGEAWGTWGVL
jgi:4-hydroxy-4-methyl-2-oxoglutarate aldolase